MVVQLRWDIQLAHLVHASLSLWFTKWNDARHKKVSPHFASEVVWELPCAFNFAIFNIISIYTFINKFCTLYTIIMKENIKSFSIFQFGVI